MCARFSLQSSKVGSASFLLSSSRSRPAIYPRRLDIAVDSDGKVGFSPVVAGLPHGDLEYHVGETSLSFDARCFVQGHRGLVGGLVELAVPDASWPLVPAPSGPGDGDESAVANEIGEVSSRRGALAYDLFGGVGLFSAALARHYDTVICVESDPMSARFARRNFRRLGLRNVEVEALRVERFIRDLPESGVDRLLLDPPRAGLHPLVRRILGERRPRRLTYVSCDPATLARDLRDMKQDFTIENVSFVDLFPQTSHIETVVQMVALPGRRAPRPSKPRPHRGGRGGRPSGGRSGS